MTPILSGGDGGRFVVHSNNSSGDRYNPTSSHLARYSGMGTINLKPKFSLDNTEISENIQKINKSNGNVSERSLGINMITTSVIPINLRYDLSEIINEIEKNNKNLMCIDKISLNKNLITLVKRAPEHLMNSLTSNEIKNRIEKIMVLESMVNAFKDLSPEQKALLDQSHEG